MRALIVGGGIGGLTAALTLARKGASVTVLEQAAAFGEVGAGVQVSPNASRVLNALGLEKALANCAFLPEAAEMRTWRRGHQLVRLPLGSGIAERFGAPYLHLHRADLHGVLASAVSETDGIAVHLGTACEGVEQGPNEGIVTTPDGRRFRADLVVGADGIKSAVRASLFGPEAARFTGCVAWRSVVPAEAVRDHDVRPVSSAWFGPGSHFVHYYLRRGELVNFVGIVEKTGWEIESWNERGEKSELLADFSGWHPTVRALTEAADPESCFKWALFDRDPLPRWSEGRVTLLGDACHPTLPFMAQGACMAIEDAAVLAECVDRGQPLPEALERYEGLRKPRTAGIQLGSRRNATLYHLRGPRAWLRNLSLPFVGSRFARSAEALWEYDAFAAAG